MKHAEKFAEQADCPLCHGPFNKHGTTGRDAALIIVTRADGTQDLFWMHRACALKLGRQRVSAMERRTNAGHPSCAACGAAWKDHEALGYASKSCPDGDGSQVYEHAPGQVGVQRPEWLVQTS